MPKFSDKSLALLNTCHQDLIVLFDHVIEVMDCTIVCGLRTKEEQDKAIMKRTSKTPWPTSKHNTLPSLAVDVVPCPVDWDDIKRFYYFAGYVKCCAAALLINGHMQHALRWGGDWDNDNSLNKNIKNALNDLPHYELIVL